MRLRKLCGNRVFFCLVLAFGYACRAETLKNPYFFVLQKDGKTSYLLGTSHLGVGIEDVPRFIIDRLKRQSIFVTETLKEEEDDSPPALPSNPPQPFSANVLRQLKERGLDEHWIQVAQRLPKLACTLYVNYEGLRDKLILDEKLEALAGELGKTKLALDDANTIAQVNEKAHGDCKIEDAIKDESGLEAKRSYQQRLKTYRAGALKDAHVDKEDDSTYDVAKRNALWTAKIRAEHPKGLFVIMGYGHLGGKAGVLELLRKDGFRVDRLTHTQK